MDLWIRSTARANLTKCDCLSIILGSEIYEKNDWEYKGYTICQCYGNNPTKSVTPLGTYRTKERALEVLDEIQNILKPKTLITDTGNPIKCSDGGFVYLSQKIKLEYQQVGTYVYEMPKE